jgi:CheY-like chemotaxis protein
VDFGQLLRFTTCDLNQPISLYLPATYLSSIHMSAEHKHKVILVADDDSEDQELLGDAISEVDPEAKAEMVFSGRAAVEYLEKCFDNELPCAIILDYSMPHLNGAEVLAILCKNSRFRAIPKFVWSTSNSKVHIDECKNYGALNYFIKPDKPDKLYSLVKEVLAACG